VRLIDRETAGADRGQARLRAGGAIGVDGQAAGAANQVGLGEDPRVVLEGGLQHCAAPYRRIVI